jgi:hypothetical protein
MGFGDTIRKSILCEHTKTVAQHDNSRQNDTLKGYQRADRSKNTLADFDNCRRKTLSKALKLWFMARILPSDLAE